MGEPTAVAAGGRPGDGGPAGPRRAVVTGATGGIGSAVVRRLAADGHAVLATGRRADALAAIAGATVTTAVCDVTDEAAVAELAGAHPDVDTLVCCAGTASAAPLARTTAADLRGQLEVNVVGVHTCLRAFLPAMVARGFGRVVVVASTAGLEGGRYLAAYAAAEHAVLGLVTSAAAEVAGTGVTVNAVCPHFVDTPMTRRSIERIVAATGRTAEEARAELERSALLGRLITPEEVAAAVAYLAMVEAAPVNGHALVMDGGGQR